MRAERMLAFISPQAVLFAILFSAQFLIRTIFDWSTPTLDFHTRAVVSTVLGVGTLLAAGFSASWRSDSIAAGTVSGILTTSLAAIISVTGAAILLVLWHDQPTMAAIRGSGGLAEVFSLPLTMILPGVVLGSLGGAACVAIKKAFRKLT